MDYKGSNIKERQLCEMCRMPRSARRIGPSVGVFSSVCVVERQVSAGTSGC